MRLNKHMEQQELFDDSIKVNIGEYSLSYPPKIYEKIKYDCSEILKIYEKTNRLLFRGSSSERMEKLAPKIYKMVPRDNRLPKDTDQIHHGMIDVLFKEKFGWRARSEGVFCSSKFKDIKTYGTPYIFLPVNGYKFVWSHTYKDLYNDVFDDLEYSLEQEAHEGGFWVDQTTGKKYRDAEDIPGFISVTATSHTDYTDYDTITVLVENDDVDDPDNEFPDTIDLEWHDDIPIDELRERRLNKVIKTYSDKNIAEAIRWGGEIMFKCKYYYLIEVSRNMTFNYLTITDFGL